MTRRWMVGVAALCMSVAGVLNAAETAVAKNPLLDALQAAYAAESSAKVRNEAFAAKADAEGYKSVAGLFRALAKSEGLHAEHHAGMIKKIGAEPKAAEDKPEVKSTQDNLEAAVKAATTAKDTMYPALVKQVEAEKDAAGATMSFKGAAAIADTNIKLCQLALKDLEGWKAVGKEFLVCGVCGYVTADQKIEKCPICAAPRTKFELVK